MATAISRDLSRRGFLTGAQPLPFRPLPPGADAQSLKACTGCGDCVTACPQDILRISGGRVAISFAAGGECTFCNACATACPEPVFSLRPDMTPETTPETIPVMAHVMAITDACLARQGVTCMSCRDACPEQAIRMMPRIGGPFLPDLSATACTGCGACLSPCPVDAIAVMPKEHPHEHA